MGRRAALRRSFVSAIVSLLAVLLVAACGGSPEVPLDSGLVGHVTIGPVCPVQREGVPCPDRPYEAELSIRDGSGREVVSVRSDADGSYRLALAPGKYRVVPLSPPGLPLPRAEAVEVTVRAGSFVTLDISYDSGIR